MTGTLNVSTEKLKQTAAAFDSTKTQVRNLTNQMTQTVNSLTGMVWSGAASERYRAKFNGLQDDIERMLRMIEEHVRELNEMANDYEQADTENVTEASTLSDDVII